MNISSPQIILSFSRSEINKLFGGLPRNPTPKPTTFQSSEQNNVNINYNDVIELEESVIVGDPNYISVDEIDLADQNSSELFVLKNNSNLLSFTHKHSTESGYVITLEVVDPSNDFEKRFVSTSPIEDLIDSSLFRDNQKFGNPFAEDIENLINSNSRPTLQQKVSKARAKEFNNRFQEATQNPKVLYLAYGIGTNTNLWSGPHIVSLIGANITFVEGLKVLTLEFIPSPNAFDIINERKGVFNSDGLKNFNFLGLTIGVEAQSKTLAWDSSENKFKYQPSFGSLGARSGDTGETNIDGLNIHRILCDIVKDLVYKVTGNPNIIVLLPDINKICKANIEERIFNPDTLGIVPNPNTNSAVEQKERAEVAIQASNTIRASAVRRLRELAAAFDLICYETVDQNAKESTQKTDNPTVQYYREVLEFEDFKERQEDYIENLKISFGKIIKQKNFLPNPKEALLDIINKISQYSSNFGMEFRFIYETNVELIEFWVNQNNDLWTFGDSQLTLDKTKPFIILGDYGLIKNFLYGNIENLDSTPNTNEQSSISPQILNPLDKYIGTTAYTESVNNLVTPKIDISLGDFGDIYQIPEAFKLEQTDVDKFKNYNIPVFRLNTENSNVLELNIKKNNIYFSILQTVASKELSRIAGNTLRGALPDKYRKLDFADEEAVIQYIRSRLVSQGVYEGQMPIINKVIRESLSINATSDQKAEEYASILANKYKTIIDNPTLKFYLDQTLAKNPLTIYYDLLTECYKRGLFEIDITVLPSFYLSNTYTLGKVVLLLVNDTKIINSKREKHFNFGNFISGLYIIQGYSHEIDSSNCVSRLKLIRLPLAGLNQQ